MICRWQPCKQDKKNLSDVRGSTPPNLIMESRSKQDSPDTCYENEDFMSEFLHFVQESFHGSPNTSSLYNQTAIPVGNDHVSMTTICPDLDLTDIEVGHDGDGVLQDIGLYLECSDDEVLHVPEAVNSVPSLTSLVGNNVRLQISFPVPSSNPNETLMCYNCEESFSGLKYLKHHIKTSHAGLISCSKCSFKTKSVKIYQNHFNRLHQLDVNCGTIQVNSKDVVPVEYVSHEKCGGENGQDFAFNSSSHENYHITVNQGCKITVHKSEMSAGDDDDDNDKPHLNKRSLRHNSSTQNRHKGIEGYSVQKVDNGGSKRIVFVCEACPYTSHSEKLLHIHKGTMHNMERKLLKCGECIASFKQRRSLDHHLKSHRASKEFTCDVCGKGFVSSDTLHRHSKTHRVERNYVCDYEGCGKKFKVRGTLTDHIKKVHQRERADVPVASIKTDFLGDVPETKPISLIPTKRNNLQAGPPSTSLPSPKTGINSTDSVNSHKRCGDRKVFLCSHPGCVKSFRDNYNLRNHLKVHTGERDIKCPHCSYCCAQTNSLNYHLKTKHSDKGTA